MNPTSSCRAEVTIPVRCKASENEAIFSYGDDIQDRSGKDSPKNLCDNTRQYISGFEAASSPEADCDSWIEMTARDVTNRVRHRQNGQAESECDANEANPKAGEMLPKEQHAWHDFQGVPILTAALVVLLA